MAVLSASEPCSRWTRPAKKTLIYSFTGQSDGANPNAGLVQDAQGNLYGTTTGEFETTGTEFKITP